MIERFGDAALRAKKAGFDGVELHGGHGYLIAEFMSSYTNKRVDQYGGILSNRLRFVKEIIEDTRAKVGADFPLFFRISSHEGMPGGRQLPDTCAIAMMLEQWGIDAIDITSGVYGDGTTVPSMAEMHAWNIDSAAAVKKVVSIPVMIVGRINEPIVAESILKSGMADIIAMGRGSLADPAPSREGAEGSFRADPPVHRLPAGLPGEPGSGQAHLLPGEPRAGLRRGAARRQSRAKKKKVVVVGGGPAGLEAARAAAARGHEVTLYEATAKPRRTVRRRGLSPVQGRACKLRFLGAQRARPPRREGQVQHDIHRGARREARSRMRSSWPQAHAL